jgi:hypothetical protein
MCPRTTTQMQCSATQHTSAYVSIRQHNAQKRAGGATRRKRQHPSAYVSIRQHTSAYVSQRNAQKRAGGATRKRWRVRMLTYDAQTLTYDGATRKRWRLPARL